MTKYILHFPTFPLLDRRHIRWVYTCHHRICANLCLACMSAGLLFEWRRRRKDAWRWAWCCRQKKSKCANLSVQL